MELSPKCHGLNTPIHNWKPEKLSLAIQSAQKFTNNVLFLNQLIFLLTA